MSAPALRPTRILEKYLVNPPMRCALQIGIVPGFLALLETTGRHSGLPRHTPVGGALLDETFWLVAEHGYHSDYVRNLLHEPQVRIKTRHTWRTGRATPMPNDDGWARRRHLDAAHGPTGLLDGLIWRALATEPLTVRIDLDPTTPPHR